MPTPLLPFIDDFRTKLTVFSTWSGSPWRRQHPWEGCPSPSGPGFSPSSPLSPQPSDRHFLDLVITVVALPLNSWLQSTYSDPDLSSCSPALGFPQHPPHSQWDPSHDAASCSRPTTTLSLRSIFGFDSTVYRRTHSSAITSSLAALSLQALAWEILHQIKTAKCC